VLTSSAISTLERLISAREQPESNRVLNIPYSALVLVFVGAVFRLQIAIAETIMGWLGVRNIFNLNLPRSFIDPSVLGNSYGFCVASVRALYRQRWLSPRRRKQQQHHTGDGRGTGRGTAGRPTSSTRAAGH
jgi:hypothetical protein